MELFASPLDHSIVTEEEQEMTTSVDGFGRPIRRNADASPPPVAKSMSVPQRVVTSSSSHKKTGMLRVKLQTTGIERA